MFDRDELQEVREGVQGAVPRDDPDARQSTSSRLFLKSLVSSFAVVFALLLLTFSGMAVPATFGSVGGISVEIGEIRGNDVSIFPAVGESAACEWEPRVEDPTDVTDRALPTVSAELGEAHVPSPYRVSFTKDIDIPDAVFNDTAMRIEMQRDEDMLPRDVNTTPYQNPPHIDPPAFTGQFIRNFNLDSTEDIPNVDRIREATAVDDSSGVRDLTGTKIYLVEGEEYSFDLTLRLIDETSVDPEFQVEEAGVTAFIDWANAGVEDEGEFEAGDEIPIGDAPATQDGLADVEEPFTVPTDVVPDDEFQAETLMRVVMSVGEDSQDIDPGGEIDAGITEEYTVVVVEDAGDIPERTEIGDIDMKTSGLEADFLDLRADEAESSSFLLDDRYSDPEDDSDNPVFTSDGEFIIEAETALDDDENTRISDVSAQLHHAAFSRLSLSQLELKVEFINSSEALIPEEETCPVLTPGFVPEITDAPFNVQPDEEFTVNGTITNPGDEKENQTLQLEFPEGVVDWEYTEDGNVTELEVEGGDTVYFDGTEEPPFDAQAPSETGRYDVFLRPGSDDPTSQEIIVGDPPEFLVDIDEDTTGPDPVVATEESLEVNYSITNAGDVSGEQDMGLFFDGTQVAEDTEYVEGSSTTHEPDFSIIPSDRHAGDPVNVTVTSEDDSDSVDVTILESPQFDVNITRAGNVTNPDSSFYDEEKWIYGEPIDARIDSRSGEHNESLGVEVNVTNTGEATDTQDIHLDIRNSLGTEFEDVDNRTDLTLDGGESEIFNLTFQPEPDRDVPEIDATVRSDDSSDRERGIRVTGEGAIYEILNLNLLDEQGNVLDEDDELEPGEEVTAEFDVRNVGNEEGEQDILLDILPDSDVPMGQPGDDSTYGTPTGDTYGVEEFSTDDPDGYESPSGDDDSLFIDAARLREDPRRLAEWDELEVDWISTGSGVDITIHAVEDGDIVDSVTVSDVSSSSTYDISDLQASGDVAVEIEGASDDPGSTWSIEEDDLTITYEASGEADSISLPKGSASPLRDWSTTGDLYRTSHEHDRDDELGLGYVNPSETESETQPGADGFGWDVELYYRLDDDSGDEAEDFSGNDRTGDVVDPDGYVTTTFDGVFGSDAYEFDTGQPAEDDNDYDDWPHRVDSRTTAGSLNSGGDSARATSVWVKADPDDRPDRDVGGVWDVGDSRDEGCQWAFRNNGDHDEWGLDLGVDESTPIPEERDGWTLDFTYDATEWTHFVATYDGDDTLRVYADGEIQWDLDFGDWSLCTGGGDEREPDFRVGEFYLRRGWYVSDQAYKFHGDIDELMQFDRHLSTSEVRELYLDGRWGDFEGEWDGDDFAAAPRVDSVIGPAGGYVDATQMEEAYPASPDAWGNVSRNQDHDVELDVSGWTQYNYVFFDWTRSGDFEQDDDGSHYVGYTSDSEFDTASTSITVPDHAEAGTTRMRVITNDDSLEDPNPEDYDGQAQDYSVFVEPDEGPEYIDAVRTGDIDMQSGDDDGYANFTDTANDTRVFQGDDFEIEVDVMAGVRDTQVYAWFDWDRSGEFTPGEDVFIGETDGEPDTVSQTITVPFGAELGETRMRVMARSEAAGDVDDPPNPNPADGYLGETEDYAVVVDDPAGVKEGVDVNESLVLESLERVNNVTLTYELEDEDAPGIETQVRSDHDAERHALGVVSPPIFDIIEEDLETNQPVTTDETLEVDFPVQNIGDLTGDVEMHLDVDANQDGNYTAVEEIDPVAADASVYPEADGDTSFDEWIERVEFESDDPEDDIDVHSGHDDGYADFTDEIAVVYPGDEYEVLVEYTGPQEGWEGTVGLWIDSDHTEDFSRFGDLEFSGYQEGGEDGIYEGTVEIPGDIQSGETVMRIIGTFDDTVPDPNDFVDEPGEAEDYTVYVPDVEGGGLSVDNETREIEAGDTEQFTLEYEPEDDDPPGINIRLRAINLARDALDDTAEMMDVQVDEPADFQIINDPEDEDNAPVRELSEIYSVPVHVENDGGVEDTQDVVLEVDGEVEDSRQLTLDVGDDEEVRLEYTTEVGDGGGPDGASSTIDVEVYTEDDSRDYDVDVDGETTFSFDDFEDPYPLMITDFNDPDRGWAECGGGDMDPLSDFIFEGNEFSTETEMRDDTDGEWSGTGDFASTYDECHVFHHGGDWDGNDNWAWSFPDGQTEEFSYYPQPEDEFEFEWAHYRPSVQGFAFGVEEGDFDRYAITWGEPDSSSTGDEDLYFDMRLHFDCDDWWPYDHGDDCSYPVADDEFHSDEFYFDEDYRVTEDDGYDDHAWRVEVEAEDYGTAGEIDVRLYIPENYGGDLEAWSIGERNVGFAHGDSGLGFYSDFGDDGSTFSSSRGGYTFGAQATDSEENCRRDFDIYQEFHSNSGDFNTMYSQDAVTNPHTTPNCSFVTESDSIGDDIASHGGYFRNLERSSRVRMTYWMRDFQGEGVWFAAQNTFLSQGYEVVTETDNNQMILNEDSDTLTTMDVNLDQGEWYQVVVDFGPGQVTDDTDHVVGGGSPEDRIYVAVLDSDGNQLETMHSFTTEYDEGYVGLESGGDTSETYLDDWRTG